MLGKLSKTFGSSSKSSAASDSASDDGSFRGGLQAGPQTEEQVFWVDHLTPEQTGKLTELRASLVAKGLLLEGTHLDTDTTLLRFLKARGWNLAKAEAMYTAMVAWRRSFGTDDVYENFEYTEKDAVLKVYPQFYCGVDRFGRPVYVEKTGLVNAAELAKHTTVERLVKFHIKCYEGLVREKFPICSKLAGREIYTTTTILDLEGLSISQFYKCKDALKAISNTDQDNYPEHLGAMIIINAPKIFTTIWSIVKPWLDTQTTSKIQIHSTNYQQALRDLIPEENIPTFYGGKREIAVGESFGPWMEELEAVGKGL